MGRGKLLSITLNKGSNMSEDYRNIPVKFFYRDVKQNFESKKQRKPIWKTEEFISIMKPGNSKDIMERIVRPLDIERWGQIYNAWKNKEEQIQSGTRLEVLPGITQIETERCKSFNVYTLEQLINIDDDGVKNLGAKGRELVVDAKKYLQGHTAANLVQKELDKSKAENKKLKAENEELKERVNELINNGTECSERDTNSSGANNGDRKSRRVHKTGVVTSDESGAGATSAT